MPAAPTPSSDNVLIAVAAHELRHPLHLMRLALARYFPRGDEHPREVMERYIDRMTRIIGDMADFVRIEQDALSLELSWLDISKMLREILDAYAPEAHHRRVKLTLEAVNGPTWVRADAQRLVQVLSNVLDNALKFTPPDGAVLVEVADVGTKLEVRVRDTGSGISPELLPRVFDLYAAATPHRGMGIGLTVARRIVQMHNGDIAVFSDGFQKGTEVVITLPVATITPRRDLNP